jgi:hypothetical protein
MIGAAMGQTPDDTRNGGAWPWPSPHQLGAGGFSLPGLGVAGGAPATHPPHCIGGGVVLGRCGPAVPKARARLAVAAGRGRGSSAPPGGFSVGGVG